MGAGGNGLTVRKYSQNGIAVTVFADLEGKGEPLTHHFGRIARAAAAYSVDALAVISVIVVKGDFALVVTFQVQVIYHSALRALELNGVILLCIRIGIKKKVSLEGYGVIVLNLKISSDGYLIRAVGARGNCQNAILLTVLRYL